jgi:nitroreductase/NAD-dependent dihydropyrimidine dehydrogenase PreA subunit
LCWENCPFRAWEIVGGKEPPRVKEVWECFSCYNCMVACPRDAISIVDVYHVDDGFWATEPRLPAKTPLQPLDADGKPDKWNAIERAVFYRRSVRNYKDRPVPETLIRRVLEAGRFAPSAGNCQPWKFIVVTNRALIEEMNEAIYNVLNMIYVTYKNDDMVKNLAPAYEASPNLGMYDPRLALGGYGAIARRYGPAFLDAPAAIIIAGDERAISGPEINIGICGQNMNLVANSLGIKSCWVGFVQVINMVPPLKEKLGVKPPGGSVPPWSSDTRGSSRKASCPASTGPSPGSVRGPTIRRSTTGPTAPRSRGKRKPRPRGSAEGDPPSPGVSRLRRVRLRRRGCPPDSTCLPWAGRTTPLAGSRTE